MLSSADEQLSNSSEGGTFVGCRDWALTTVLVGALGLCVSALSFAGSVFVTGHDPDYHAIEGNVTNPVGAQHIVQRALEFTRNGNTAPILFIQTDTSNLALPLNDHLDSEDGLISSGFTAASTPGNHYVRVNATEFATINLSLFSAIFVASDHGGTLAGNDLQAINARTADILSYINAGGGLVALAEDGFRQPASVGPQPASFGFLPFLVTAVPLGEEEQGNTLTPFGASLGLLTSDINENFSHAVFTATGGMSIVDTDSAGEILSLAFRGLFGLAGVAVIPEPSTLILFAFGLAGLAAVGRRRTRLDVIAFVATGVQRVRRAVR